MTQKVMRVLITGAGGFIGSALTAVLANTFIDGLRVEVFHLKRQGAAKRPVDSVATAIVLPGLSRDDFVTALHQHRFDYVLHLASYGVSRSDRLIAAMIEGNVTFLVNLLSALGPTPRLIVNIGSCAEYGHVPVGERINEDTPLRPVSVYGGVKAAAEMIATALAHENSQRFTTLRLFGVYGEGEGAQRLLPFLVERMSRGEPVDLTAGTQIRDWLHVHDVVSGLLALLNAEASGLEIEASYNLCSGVGISVREFVDEIRLAMGVDDELLQWGSITRSDEPTWLVGDPGRFHEAIGWSPRIALREGVARAVAHFVALDD